MTNQFHPLRYTADEFSEQMYSLFGRGKAQALALYQCFIREGSIRDDLPEFRNAPFLYTQMRQAMDLKVDPVAHVFTDERATKFLMTTSDGFSIESVVMSMQGRKTLCLSSQIGCRMGCAFCLTGQMGFQRNLSVEEIVQQLFAARHVLKNPIQNVVFMGMGEPFDNFDAVMQAVRVISDPLAFGIGLRRITISTSGDINGITYFANATQALPNLAVSLGAPTDAIRSQLMPSRRRQPLHELYKAMHQYCMQKQQQILISYVLLKDVNDSIEYAEKLVAYVRGLDVRINVIPYNPSPDSLFSRPSQEVMKAFINCLRSQGLPVFVRHEKGCTIHAACGQLGGKSHKRIVF